MQTDLSLRRIAAALIILAATVAIYFSRDAQSRSLRAPDTVEAFGAFESVTRGDELAGTDYALLYRGAPFEFVGKAGMFGDKTARYTTFNAVFTFAPNASGTPAILVNVGDPNNDSFFYLLRDVAGKAEAQYVGEANGAVTVKWIEPLTSNVTNVWDAQRHRGRLAGGRWALVGKYTAIDMLNLKVYPLAQARTAADPNPSDWMPVIAMSPDQLSFVRYGNFQRIVANRIQNENVFIVTELTTERWYMVPIRRSIERYNDYGVDVNAEWLNYYFTWRPETGKPARMVSRTNIKPRPYIGQRPYKPEYASYPVYRLTSVSTAMRGAFLEYLERVEGGKRLPDSSGGSGSVVIDGATVHVTPQNDELGLWMDSGKKNGLIYEIGDRFDAVLATGAYDKFFLP
jgi:hypothetical protein